MNMSDNKLEFDRYRDRFKIIYSSLSEREREEIFNLRVDLLRMIVDNYTS